MRKQSSRWLDVLLLIMLGLAMTLDPQLTSGATFFTVNSTADAVDANPGDGACRTAAGECTLRAAIQEANAFAGDDTITLPSGVYTLAIGGRGEDAAATGDLDVNDNLTMTGAGASTTIIDAATLDRVLDVDSDRRAGITVTIAGVTIRNGLADGDNYGGGIRNFGTLTLDGVTVTSNRATGGNGAGGGIAISSSYESPGAITIRNSAITNNVADEVGGGIFHTPVQGDITIVNSVISGNVATNEDAGGIFNGSTTGNISITDSTISNNTAARNVGGIYHAPEQGDVTIVNSEISGNVAMSSDVGGIYLVPVNGNLSIANSNISNNTAERDGGGIYHAPSNGNVSIANSNVSNNIAERDAGGIYSVAATGDLTITNSTVSGNSGGRVGGISHVPRDGGDLTVVNSTVSNNTSALDGGGIYSWAGAGAVSITNSTISGNTAGNDGGGIYNGNPLTLLNVTITDNTSGTRVSGGDEEEGNGDGGGIAHFVASLTAKNTIIAGNAGAGPEAPDCWGELNSQGHNLIQNTTGCALTGDLTGNVIGQDARLGPLQNNGGSTFTHALLVGSPALDAGDNTNAPATDQRGVARPFDGNQDGNAACDIGAYESIPDLTGAWGTLTQTATADQKVIFYGGVFARTQTSNSLNGTFSAQNQEAAAAPSSTIRFFLSDNATWDEEDTLLQEVASGTVNGGAARNVNLNVNLPANTNAAGKFVIAVVDATNGVAESNEGNNVTASAAIVKASRTVQQRPTAKPAKRKSRSRSK